MLRISCADVAETRVLRLEGWLTAEHLSLLDEAVAGAAGRRLTLDLSALRGVDGVAAAQLNALRAAGAALTACSAFVERLLAIHRR